MTKQGTDLYFQNLPKDKFPPDRTGSEIDLNRNLSIGQSILDHCSNTNRRCFFWIYESNEEKNFQHQANLHGEP